MGARTLGIDKIQRFIDQALFVRKYFQEKEGRTILSEFSRINLSFDKDPKLLDHIWGRFHIVMAVAFLHHVKPVEKVAEHFSRIATEKIIVRLVKNKGMSDVVFKQSMKDLGWKITHDDLIASPKLGRYFVVYEK
ncbi:unnamed protein product [marine sediment metagenome]|uniref:Uncharacterized protein n=1 Tax=marine sediment metagenome TaxID=412755 RepID=X1HVR5_9ZZZZ